MVRDQLDGVPEPIGPGETRSAPEPVSAPAEAPHGVDVPTTLVPLSDALHPSRPAAAEEPGGPGA